MSIALCDRTRFLCTGFVCAKTANFANILTYMFINPRITTRTRIDIMNYLTIYTIACATFCTRAITSIVSLALFYILYIVCKVRTFTTYWTRFSAYVVALTLLFAGTFLTVEI